MNKWTEMVRSNRFAPREPHVKIYKDDNGGANGPFAVVTTATTPGEFLVDVRAPLLHALVDAGEFGEQHWTLIYLLPQICEVWARLKGYKAEGVHEERRLIAGVPNPEGRMREVGRCDHEGADHGTGVVDEFGVIVIAPPETENGEVPAE